jgi:hypothetical protein
MLTLYFPIWKANHKDYYGKRERSKTFLRICTGKLYESTLFDNSTIIYLRKWRDKSETKCKVIVYVFFFNEIFTDGIYVVLTIILMTFKTDNDETQSYR